MKAKQKTRYSMKHILPMKLEYQQYDDGSHACVAAPNGDWIADCGMEGTESETSAEFIVKACNNHYQLLEALKKMVNEYETFADIPENYKKLKGWDGEENPRTIAIIKALEAIKNAEQ